MRSTKADSLEKQLASRSDEVFSFTDSAGRTVVLPVDIKAVSPSGAYAQIMLCTLCPDKLMSLSSRFSTAQAKYFDERTLSLPAFGRFYGKNADMNYEEIIRQNPDVIIDIGEAKESIASDMDGLQEQTGIPVIFVEATITHVAEAYRTLGFVLGVRDRAEELAAYVDGVLDFAAAHHDAIAQRNQTVMYSTGEYGYSVKEAGGVHAMPLDLLGLKNVAELGNTNSTEVSPEQVLLWNPHVLLLSPSDGFYEDIYDDPAWSKVAAVAARQVYEVPEGPYEWLDGPPSVQIILGVEWLGNLLFPEIYDFDIVGRVKTFYHLFWHYDLQDAEAKELMANSTFVSGRVS